MAEDLDARVEELVAVDVVAVVVREDQPAERLAGGLLRRGDETARRNGPLQRIDGDQMIAADDDARVGDARGGQAGA